jgi:hypothetical protein
VTWSDSDSPAAVVALTLAVLLAGCAGRAPLTTAVELPSLPRHPDGVMLDPPAAVPVALERASARGVVALREPAGEEDALRAVHDFVQGFVRGDKGAIHQMLADHATQLDSRGFGTAESLGAFFDLRLRSFDYTKLAGTEVYRADQVEHYAYEELGGGGGRPRPGEMREGDVLVRVPILTPRVGNDRLFGDVVVLLLRREEGRFKLAGYGEDSSP